MDFNPSSFEEVSCNLCGSDRRRAYTAIRIEGRRVASIVKCKDCGLEYTSPRPAPSFVSALYQYAYNEHLAKEAVSSAPEASGKDHGGEHGRYVDYVDDLGRLAPSGGGGRLLDVGAGFGYLLDLARARGWEVWGTDISHEAAEVARRQTGAQVAVVENLKDANFTDGFFDAVTMSAVIEHLRDPFGTLGEVHRILKTGGLLGVFTDNNDSLFLALGQMREKVEVRYESLTGRRFPVRGRNKERYGVIAASYDKGVFTLSPAKDDPQTVAYFCVWAFQHIFFFTPTSLRKMLARAGFEVVAHPAGRILGGPAAGKRRILQNELVNKSASLLGRQSEVRYYAIKQ